MVGDSRPRHRVLSTVASSSANSVAFQVRIPASADTAPMCHLFRQEPPCLHDGNDPVVGQQPRVSVQFPSRYCGLSSSAPIIAHSLTPGAAMPARRNVRAEVSGAISRVGLVLQAQVTSIARSNERPRSSLCGHGCAENLPPRHRERHVIASCRVHSSDPRVLSGRKVTTASSRCRAA